jgi:hypothetical protein
VSRLRGVVAVTLALLGALPLLLLLDDERRVWGFRAYVAVVAVLAARSIVRWTDVAGAMSAGNPDDPDPFRRPSRLVALVRRAAARVPVRRQRRLPLAGGAIVVHSAMSTAGGVHHRLRPLLQEIAEERLRSHLGSGLDAGARALVGERAWAIVDPHRPAPHDRLAPGLTATEIALALDDLENL